MATLVSPLGPAFWPQRLYQVRLVRIIGGRLAALGTAGSAGGTATPDTRKESQDSVWWMEVLENGAGLAAAGQAEEERDGVLEGSMPSMHLRTVSGAGVDFRGGAQPGRGGAGDKLYSVLLCVEALPLWPMVTCWAGVWVPLAQQRRQEPEEEGGGDGSRPAGPGWSRGLSVQCTRQREQEGGPDLGPLLPSPSPKSLPGTEARKQGSSSYSPETLRGWPGGGSRGLQEPSLPPSWGCNPTLQAAALLLLPSSGLWPLGRTLQASRWLAVLPPGLARLLQHD